MKDHELLRQAIYAGRKLQKDPNVKLDMGVRGRQIKGWWHCNLGGAWLLYWHPAQVAYNSGVRGVLNEKCLDRDVLRQMDWLDNVRHGGKFRSVLEQLEGGLQLAAKLDATVTAPWLNDWIVLEALADAMQQENSMTFLDDNKQ